MNSYKTLNKQVYSSGQYSIVPIRMEDRYDIMRWRNEQMYHLRQNKPLTKDDQDRYFEEVVSKLFDQDKPDQILFSYLEGEKCIGYGGLVHINWIDRNAEVSFILDKLNNEYNYIELSVIYLQLITNVGNELMMHKIYTYGYDFADYRFEPLYKNGFQLDAFLHEHALIDSNLVPVRIYSKLLVK
jgi:hypothetical protein